MSRIVFFHVDPEDEDLVREKFIDAVIFHDSPEGDALVKASQDAEIVSGFVYTKFPKEVITRLPKLKLLCTRSVGFDHIDVAACEKQGISVCHVPDYGSHVIAEHVFALLLSTLRHIPEADKKVERGLFDYHGLRGMSLRGKTIGIIGTGKIGRKVAEISHGFGMKILATDTCRVVGLEEVLGLQYVEYDVLLSESDIITLHVPATKETHHMVNAYAFSKMKEGIVLVNTARGELIDSLSLLQALQSGKVRYALLDVLEHEKNFEENKELIEHPNVVTTPHIAFYAAESMHVMYDDCFRSIEQYQKGEKPEHLVQSQNLVCDMKGVRN